MGGRQSNRWSGHLQKPLVEEALGIDLLHPATLKLLARPHATGDVTWTRPGTAALLGRVEFRLSEIQADGSRRLVFEFSDDLDGPREVIVLVPVPAGFSRHWRAECPRRCGRTVRKVYLIPGQARFGCRICGGFEYRSTQRHDRRLDLARRDLEGFRESRARAPRTIRSQLVTARLLLRAAESHAQPRRGRGWGRQSVTSLSRAVTEIRRDYEQRWGFPQERAFQHAAQQRPGPARHSSVG